MLLSQFFEHFKVGQVTSDNYDLLPTFSFELCQWFYDSTAGLNFINIIFARFLYERCFGSFFYVHVTRKSCQNRRSNEKHLRITLMKLTPGLNFTNILRTAFALIDPEGVKDTDD